MDKMILLADRNSNAWDFSNKIQKYIEEKYKIKIPLMEVEISHFRNREIYMHIPMSIRKKEIYFIQDSTKDPQTWWVELLLLKDLLLGASAESVTLVLPDMYYSRQDRKDKPHVPISARALANSISSDLKKIITMDLHAAQLQGFYPQNIPVDNLYSFPEVVRHLREKHSGELEKMVVVSPDAGSAPRAKAFLKKLEKAQKEDNKKQEYSIALIDKTRSKQGEIEEMKLIGDVKNKNVFIPDDIIDSGNTLCGAAKLLKKKGAKKLFCYGTHGLFTEGPEKVCKDFDFVMTSNTHHQKFSGLEVIDMSPLFAEAIYRAQKGLSISELFE